ncbi:MAG: S9 family peptidase [Bowdeniella nasicola]|nr:S9 family peptidase [Bowdeniella nasicola]
MSEATSAPRAPHRDTIRTVHGEEVCDPYEWLRDRDNPEVIELLEAENAYMKARTSHLGELEADIFAEIKSRTKETDLSVPQLRDGWWYYARTEEGEQYPRWARVRDAGERPKLEAGRPIDGEQILVDGPALAEGEAYFALGDLEIAPGGDWLAYGVDTSGDERYDVVVVDLRTGEKVDMAITGAGYGLAFGAEASALYYVRVNEAWRPHQVWRHRIGNPVSGDELVYQEDDERFWMMLETSKDGQTIVIQLASSTTGEAHLIDASDPQARPRCVAQRRPGLDYSVEVAPDHLLIVHNATHQGFEVARAPLADPAPENWQTVHVAGEGERILGVSAFCDHAAIALRTGGRAGVRVLPYEAGRYGQAWDIPSASEIATLELGANPRFDSRTIRYVVESLATPPTVAQIDVATREVEVLKRTEVPGGYDPEDYIEHRLWVRSRDGKTDIPVSLVARRDVAPDGTNPGLLYGYGSYEVSIDPTFSPALVSLLERGVVYAIAHVRGGGEMGRAWYEDGKLTAKKHTFEDFIDCGRHLIESGWVHPQRLAARGGSAGGLLMGAVTNMAPDLWCAVHAAVPFVDALTTILKPELPLTAGEWEEWGNPIESAEVYHYMRSYTPFENIAARPYPAILATTSLNDTRVYYVEPLKWVQRLRESVTSDQDEWPILLHCEMVAGHGGASGRYDAWRERAREFAFLLDQLGARELR